MRWKQCPLSSMIKNLLLVVPRGDLAGHSRSDLRAANQKNTHCVGPPVQVWPKFTMHTKSSFWAKSPIQILSPNLSAQWIPGCSSSCGCWRSIGWGLKNNIHPVGPPEQVWSRFTLHEKAAFWAKLRTCSANFRMFEFEWVGRTSQTRRRCS